MLLNEYLNLMLGGYLSPKLNRLAVKEILSHPEVYPELSEYKELLETMDKTHEYDSVIFDYPDAGHVISAKEVFVFYQAFVRAYFGSRRCVSLKAATLGIGIIKDRNMESLFPVSNKEQGTYLVTVSRANTSFYKDVTVPDYEYGAREECSAVHYRMDNHDLILKTKAQLHCLTDYEVFHWGLDMDRAFERGDIGYTYYLYELAFDDGYMGDNLFVFYTMERGFDPLSAIFMDIRDYLKTMHVHNEVTDFFHGDSAIELW